jgi:hypothetical protein
MPATTQSTQRIAQVGAATSFAKRLDDARQISGPVQYAFIDVPIAPENVQGNVIDLLELPPGAIVIPELSFINVTDDMSSGAVSVDIGDAVDVDRYCDGANLAAVGTVQFLAPALPAAYTTRHECVDTGTAATTTTLVKLTFAILGATVEVGALRVVLAYKSL